MAQGPDYKNTGIEYYSISSFKFASGTTLHDLKVAYRSFNPDSSNGVVVIPTCYGGIINQTLAFRESPYDALAKYHVVVMAMLGNGESASPSNKPMFPEEGELRYPDVINAHYQTLTEHLHIKEVEAVIGFSMGAQQAYHWAVIYPDFVKRAVAICGSARTSPHNYAFLEGPIGALKNSIDYIAWSAVKEKAARGEDVGHNLKEVKPKRGLIAFGRAYAAWLTSTFWFREKHWTGQHGLGGAKTMEEWLQNCGEGELGWDADDLLVLARMWQMGDIGKVYKKELEQLGGALSNDKDFEEALGSIKAKVLVMPCRTDQYFPPEDSEIEMRYLEHGTYEPIESVWGHVSGGGLNPEDTEFMNQKIADFMKK